LLREGGVILTSIDDNGLPTRGLLMRRVFGEADFVANVIWRETHSPKLPAKHFFRESRLDRGFRSIR
jgi:adenine-specific DNA-methyltransferase